MAGSPTRCPTSRTAALLLVLMPGCTNDYDGLTPSAASNSSSSSSSSASGGGAGGGTASASSTGGLGGAAGGAGGAASSTAAGPGGAGGVGGSTGGAGGQPPLKTIDCADGVQCSGDEVCCIEDQLPSGFDVACARAAACDAVPAMCDGQEDCDGEEICCGHYLPNGDYDHIECQPNCNGAMEVEMCHLADRCVTGTCQLSDKLGSPWGYCN